MVLSYPETKQPKAQPLEHPSAYPGVIYRHKTTGKLIGIVSCDKHHWVEVVNASAARYELPLESIHDKFSEVSRANLTVLSRIEDDHRGEWPICRETWRVSQSALVHKLGEVAR